MLAAGAPLPPVRLVAAESGVVVDNAYLAGRRAAIAIHGARNTEVPKAVARAVRERWPEAKDVVLATVVDLRSFAGLWKRVAEAQVKSTHDKLAAKAREMGLDPKEHVLIVPDWDGAASQSLGLEAPDKAPGVVVVGRDGKVVGVAQGPDVAAETLRLLDTA